jgi:hypothetical protein
MKLRLPATLLTLFGFAFGTQSSQREAELQPASSFIFRWSPVRTDCDPIPTKGFYVKAVRNTPVNLQRLDQLHFSSDDAPELRVTAESALIEIDGSSSDTYSVQLCASAGAATEADAKSTLDAIKLSRDGDMLTVVSPSGNATRRSMAHVRVRAPADHPVNITGTYTAMAVHGIHAPVKLSTTHARISVLDSSADVDANAGEFGIVDFSGYRGNVRLTSATDINVQLTRPTFEGRLHATADRPLRVLLPSGFASPFEAVVNRRDEFVCRADLCSRITSVRKDGRFVFKYGDGDAVLSFVSTHGPVVLDTAREVAVGSRKY